MRVDDFYENQYQKLIWQGFVGRLVGIAHKVMEFRYHSSQYHENVLEGGGGQGQHLLFVKSKFTNYFLTDLIPPKESYAADSGIVAESQDAQELTYSDGVFDRVIATCLLPHLDFPANALKEWRRVIKPGGLITIYVTADPGIMLRFFRLLLVSSKAVINDCGNHLRTSHIGHRNSYLLYSALISETFKTGSVRFHRYPFPFLSWNFDMLAIAHTRKSTAKADD